MPRSVYERAVYNRENQLFRKVYDRSRNVIPTNPLKYKVKSASVAGTMEGYVSDETITILGAEGDTSAVLKITAAEGVITALEVVNPGLYAENIAGSVSTYEYSGSGTGAEITVATEAVDE